MTGVQAIPVARNAVPPRPIARIVSGRDAKGWAIDNVTDAAPDWTACLKRVRDAQDQAAFAALMED